MPGPRGAPPALSGHRGRTHAVYIQNADRFSARPLPLCRSRSDSRHRIERMQQAVHSGCFQEHIRQGPDAGRSGSNVKTARHLRGQAARQTETGRTPAHPSMSAISLYVPPRFRKRDRCVLPRNLSTGSFHSGQTKKLFLITDLHQMLFQNGKSIFI